MNQRANLFVIICGGICLALVLLNFAQVNAQTTEASTGSAQSTASVSSDTIVSPAPTRTLSLAECLSKADRDNKDIAVAKK
ncbi:MAG: hypothetical protein C5B53_13120, partial [Candidatus Melainabacteria bacterium]